MRVIGTSELCLLGRISVATVLAACASASVQGRSATSNAATVRAELERLYAENAKAFERGDLAALMRLRAPDFHTVTPDGRRLDRAAMERNTQGFMNGIRKWNAQRITIDSLHVVGDTAHATVTQHLDRMALRLDNQVHHVETWVTQRESWVRHGATWLLWRVDQVRNQRRLIDGQPDQPSAATRAADSTAGGLRWIPSWPGTEIAIVSGNPSAAGPFVFRFRMPDAYCIPPHTHPVDARISVISGTFLVGMGDVLDMSRVRVINRGDSIVIHAGMAHFEGARGAVEIEIRGSGPWGIQFLDPQHDPTRGGVSCGERRSD